METKAHLSVGKKIKIDVIMEGQHRTFTIIKAMDGNRCLGYFYQPKGKIWGMKHVLALPPAANTYGHFRFTKLSMYGQFYPYFRNLSVRMAECDFEQLQLDYRYMTAHLYKPMTEYFENFRNGDDFHLALSFGEVKCSCVQEMKNVILYLYSHHYKENCHHLTAPYLRISP